MSTWKLELLDVAFSAFHTGLIVFVLGGWIRRRWLRLHLAALTMIGFSWFVLGLRYGIGYCPCTDWHWWVKRQLGQFDLPHSYVEYLLNQVGVSLGRDTVDLLTAGVFFGALTVSVVLNVRCLPGRKQ